MSIVAENRRDIRVGCVACTDALALPEDTDLTLAVQLLDEPLVSTWKRVVVHTPKRLDGRNGRRPGPWVPAAPIIAPAEPAATVAPTPAPLGWPLRVLLFLVMPFVAGYVTVTFAARARRTRGRSAGR
jgi:hypothetical protein